MPGQRAWGRSLQLAGRGVLSGSAERVRTVCLATGPVALFWCEGGLTSLILITHMISFPVPVEGQDLLTGIWVGRSLNDPPWTPAHQLPFLSSGGLSPGSEHSWDWGSARVRSSLAVRAQPGCRH